MSVYLPKEDSWDVWVGADDGFDGDVSGQVARPVVQGLCRPLTKVVLSYLIYCLSQSEAAILGAAYP